MKNPDDTDIYSKDITQNEKILLETYQQQEFIVYPYRYVILFSFTMIHFASHWCANTLGAVMNLVALFYDVPILIVTLTSLSYLIVNVPMNFLANFIIEKKGLYPAIFLGALLTFVGSWIRNILLINHYYMFAIGTLITAIGQPFLLNVPAKVAGVWFGSDQRAIATTIGQMAAPLGGIGGFVFPIFFKFQQNDKPELYDQGRQQFNQYIFYQNIFISFFCGFIILMKNKPNTPPSSSACQEKIKFKESLKILYLNQNYKILVITFSLIYAIYNVLASCLSIMSSDWGYSAEDNSLFGAVATIGGIIGAVIFGRILDKTYKYKQSLLFISYSIFIVCIIGSNIFRFKYKVLVTISTFFLGASIVPVLPIGFGLASEISFPIDEAQSTGSMMMVAQVISTFVVLLTTYLLELNFWYGAYLLYFITGLAIVFSHLVKEDLKIKKYEQEQEESKQIKSN